MKDILHVQGYKKDKRSSIASCDGRVVKALDLNKDKKKKGVGLEIQWGLPAQVRTLLAAIKFLQTKNCNDQVRKPACAMVQKIQGDKCSSHGIKI